MNSLKDILRCPFLNLCDGKVQKYEYISQLYTKYDFSSMYNFPTKNCVKHVRGEILKFTVFYAIFKIHKS